MQRRVLEYSSWSPSRFSEEKKVSVSKVDRRKKPRCKPFGSTPTRRADCLHQVGIRSLFLPNQLRGFNFNHQHKLVDG